MEVLPLDVVKEPNGRRFFPEYKFLCFNVYILPHFCFPLGQSFVGGGLPNSLWASQNGIPVYIG